MKTIEKLGVDVGGVIIDRVNDASDTSFFGDNYLQTTSVPGALAALRRLNRGRFAGRVYLVSKCGARVQAKTLAWLAHHDFYGTTGIAPEHVHFCRQRQDKAGICAALGITHFVDDRLEVLGYLTTVPARYLFRPDPAEVARYAHVLPEVRRVESWAELLRDLLPPRRRGRIGGEGGTQALEAGAEVAGGQAEGA
ncbi:MAG TPA: hypothetical protein VK066_27470 [Chloroflexota bacterium]|nr:hypothetical protein [Chloroflexota bacterium]